jgi:two-component system OmpR family response regulator
MNTQGDDRRVAVIIEDDADIRHLLETVLTQAGFDAIATSNGLDGIQAVRRYNPIVTTLDVSMPGMDGFETAKRLRAFSTTYIVMLTARDEEIDTLQGLDSGADDYLTKPFRPRELRARIEAMLRRPRQVVSADAGELPAASPTPSVAEQAYAPAAAVPVAGPVAAPTAPPLAAPVAASFPDPVAAPIAAPVAAPAAVPVVPVAPVAPAVPVATPGTLPDSAAAQTIAEPAAAGSEGEGWIEYNGLRVNPEMRLAVLGQNELDLTRSEFDLLAAIFESKRRVRSKADLALLLRGESYVTAYFVNEADKRAVEVHMGNLRRKLGDSLSSPRWLETVRGVGYRLAASHEG